MYVFYSYRKMLRIRSGPVLILQKNSSLVFGFFGNKFFNTTTNKNKNNNVPKVIFCFSLNILIDIFTYLLFISYLFSVQRFVKNKQYDKKVNKYARDIGTRRQLTGLDIDTDDPAFHHENIR